MIIRNLLGVSLLHLVFCLSGDWPGIPVYYGTPTVFELLPCTGPGIFQHPKNCSRFYRCVDADGEGGYFSPIIFQCKDGLVFEEATGVCNYPSKDSTCYQRGTSTERIKGVPPTEDPEVDSQTTTAGSSEGYESTTMEDSESPESLTTQDPDSSESLTTPDQESSESLTTQDPYSEELQTVDPESVDCDPESGNCRLKTKPLKARIHCKTEGFFRNPEDCHNFFRCVDNGGRTLSIYEFQCPNNLVFDEELVVCNWPTYAASCEDNSENGKERTTASSRTSIEPSQETSTPQFVSKQPDPATQPPSIKPTPESTRKPIIPSKLKPSKKPMEEATRKPNVPRPNASRKPGKPTKRPFATKTTPTDTVTESPTTAIPIEVTTEFLNVTCEMGGFHRHPEDCGKFYRCVEHEDDAVYTVYQFKCPGNLVFDEELSVCNWVQFTAPPCGYYFAPTNETNEITDTDKNKWQKRTTTSSSNIDTSSTEPPSTIDSNNSSEGYVGTNKQDVDCPEANFFKNPLDCRKFYRCVEGPKNDSYTVYHFKCPELLAFDETILSCNWPEKSNDCQNGEFDGMEEDVYNFNVISGEKIRSKRSAGNRYSYNHNPNVILYQAEFPCQDAGFYRNPSNCGQFYRCVEQANGKEKYSVYKFDCPSGLYFDEDIGACNWPENVRSCGGAPNWGAIRDPESVVFVSKTEEQTQGNRATSAKPNQSSEKTKTKCEEDAENAKKESSRNQIRPESTTSSGVASSVESSSSSSSGTSSGESSSSSSSGTGQSCSKEGFFRDPNDCHKFIRCVDQAQDGSSFSVYKFECSEGLLFDEAYSVCNWPGNSAPCGDNGSSNGGERNSNSQTTTSTSQTDGGNFGPTVTRVTSRPGSSQRTTLSQKTTTTRFFTPSSRPVTPRPTIRTTQGSPQSSRTRVTSRPGSSERTTTTQLFTPSSRPVTPRPTIRTTEGSPQSSKTTKITPAQTGSSSNKKGLSCESEGFYQNPEDCNKFYRCVNTHEDGHLDAVEFSCPDGLVFDENKSVCNWPEYTACGGSRRQNSTVTTPSTDVTNTRTDPTSTSTTGIYSTTPYTEYVDIYSSTTSGLTSTVVSSVTGRPGTALESTTSRTGSGSTGIYETSSTSETENSQTTVTETGGSLTSTTSSEETSKGSLSCESVGYFRNPGNCNKFYRCVDTYGTRQLDVVEFDCPEGLVFDERYSICSWPESAPPCDGKSNRNDTKGEEVTSGTSISSSDSATGITDSTASTTEFSRGTSVPDYSTTDSSGRPTETGRYSTETTRFTSDITVTRETGTPESQKRHNCSESVTDTTRGSTSNSFESTTDTTRGSTSISIESTTDSTRVSTSTTDYYTTERTNSDRSTTSSTGGITESATLTSSDSDLSSSSGGRTTDTSITTQSNSTSSPPGVRPQGGNPQCSQDGFYRNPENCHKFYRCVENQGSYSVYHFDCPDGLVFDERYSTCNWAHTAPACDDENGDGSTDTRQRNSTPSSEVTDSASTSLTGVDSQATGTTQTGTDVDSSTTQAYSTTYKYTTSGGYTTTNPNSVVKTTENAELPGFTNSPTVSTTNTHTSESTTYDSSTSTGDTSSTTETSQPATSTEISDGNTTSNSNQNLPCSQEGFYRDPSDCRRFYRCVTGSGQYNEGFSVYQFNCPDGLVFDERYTTCNWPENSPPCDGSYSGGNSTSVTPIDPDNGSTVSEGTTVERETEIYTTESGSSTAERGSSTTKSEISTTETVQSIIPPGSSISNCSDSRNSGTSNSTSSTVETNTNSTTNTDSSSSSSTSTSSSSTDQSNSSNNNTSVSTNNSTKTSGTSSSSSRCSEEGFFREPSDCHKFIRCVKEGETYSIYNFDCPEGLVFDERYNTCNWAESAPACDGSSVSRTGSSSNNRTANSTTSPSGSSTDSSTTGTATSGSPSGSSSSENTESSSSGSQTSSNSSSGSQTSIGSSSGSQTSTGSSSGSQTSTGSSSSSSTSTSSSSSEKSQTTSSNTSSRKNITSSTSSSSTSSQTSSTSSKNSSSTQSSKTTSQGRGGECSEEGFFRDQESCSKFYRCVNEGNSYSVYNFDCPEGLVFDDRYSTCNWPESAPPCEDGDSSARQNLTSTVSNQGGSRTPQTSPHTSTQSTTRYTTTTQTSTQPTTSQRTISESSVTTVPTSSGTRRTTTSPGSNVQGQSECLSAGFFRDPEDCNRFHRCIDENGDGKSYYSVEFSCPAGLVFDESYAVCNWPQAVSECSNYGLSGESTSSSSRKPTESSSSRKPAETSENSRKKPTAGSQSKPNPGSSGQRPSEAKPVGNTGRKPKPPVTDRVNLYKCPAEGNYPFEADCNHFYRCLRCDEGDIRGLLYVCPQGYIYNESSRLCKKMDRGFKCNRIPPNQLIFRPNEEIIKGSKLAGPDLIAE